MEVGETEEPGGVLKNDPLGGAAAALEHKGVDKTEDADELDEVLGLWNDACWVLKWFLSAGDLGLFSQRSTASPART